MWTLVLLGLALVTIAGITMMFLAIFAWANGLSGVTPVGTFCVGSLLIGSSSLIFHLVHKTRTDAKWRKNDRG